MVGFDFELEQATPEWLTSILTENGFLAEGKVSSVKKEATLPGAGNASNFFSLKVEYAEGSLGYLPSSIIMKMQRREFYDVTHKEMDFYEDAMEQRSPLPILTCYGTEKSPATKQGYLLLEDLTHTHHPIHAVSSLSQEEAEEAAERAVIEAIEALAKVHAYGWNHQRFEGSVAETFSEEGMRNVYRPLEEQYPPFVNAAGDRLSERRREIYDRVMARLPEVLGRRYSSTKRLTICHGDCHLGNFLFPNETERGRCILLDWQNVTIGWGVADLSYMIALNMSSEERRAAEMPILKLYLEELQKKDIDYTWEDLQTDYRICIISNLLTPVWQHSAGVASSTWRGNLERGFAAFEDLDCLELLS